MYGKPSDLDCAIDFLLNTTSRSPMEVRESGANVLHKREYNEHSIDE